MKKIVLGLLPLFILVSCGKKTPPNISSATPSSNQILQSPSNVRHFSKDETDYRVVATNYRGGTLYLDYKSIDKEHHTARYLKVNNRTNTATTYTMHANCNTNEARLTDSTVYQLPEGAGKLKPIKNLPPLDWFKTEPYKLSVVCSKSR